MCERLTKMWSNDVSSGCNDEFLKFENVENKLSQRPDLHAFMLLDSLFPGDINMVSGASHDEFYLSISPEELSEKATDEQLIDLHRCGVRYDESNDSLAMFT
jgi:hypothetical protein